MIAEKVQKEFREKVCAQISILKEGINRYRVFTPFIFEDGDHLAIVLKKAQSGWMLSDEGHTFMHLTYRIDERDFQTGTRQTIITNALSVFEVEDREGELILPVRNDEYGDALYSFAQALMKITDISFLTRERVRSTFMDDFRNFFEDTVPQERMTFNWHDPDRDIQGMYNVDCRINGMPRPLFVFALPNDAQTRDATIAMHQFERWNISYRSMAIFEEQESINRKVLARFSDVSDKQFSSLNANKDRIQRYLDDVLDTP